MERPPLRRSDTHVPAGVARSNFAAPYGAASIAAPRTELATKPPEITFAAPYGAASIAAVRFKAHGTGFVSFAAPYGAASIAAQRARPVTCATQRLRRSLWSGLHCGVCGIVWRGPVTFFAAPYGAASIAARFSITNATTKMSFAAPYGAASIAADSRNSIGTAFHFAAPYGAASIAAGRWSDVVLGSGPASPLLMERPPLRQMDRGPRQASWPGFAAPYGAASIAAIRIR